MTSSRTDSKIKKRQLLRIIINNLIDLYGCLDIQLERVPLMKLQSIDLDSEDFLKWARADRHELPRTNVFLPVCKMRLESEVPLDIEAQRELTD